MVKVEVTSRFSRSFNGLPLEIQRDFSEKITIFIQHPFDPRLKSHKLKGRLGDYYAFRLRDGYRVLFDLVREDTVLFVNIGSHNDYNKWTRP